jgi:hypothetical protein
MAGAAARRHIGVGGADRGPHHQPGENAMNRNAMNRFAALSLCLAVAAPALAVEPQAGAQVGSDPGAIAAAMGESGYAVTRFEREGGRIEVRVEKDGRSLRFDVDAASGRIARLREGGGAPGDRVGTTDAEIRASLTAQGYEVRKIERDDGVMEAYALRDGKRYEIYVDPNSGEVLRVKEDD